MINLHDIRYARLGTQDLDSAICFATDIVGLQLVAREGSAAYFRSDKADVRGDTRDHTLVYFEGDPADQTIGLELIDPDDLDAVGAALERGRPFRVLNWIHLLAEAMGLPYTDQYKLWRNAEDARAAVGADRIAAAGDLAFERLVEPELRRASTV